MQIEKPTEKALETRQVVVRVTPELHKRLAYASVDRGTKMTVIIRDLLEANLPELPERP